MARRKKRQAPLIIPPGEGVLRRRRQLSVEGCTTTAVKLPPHVIAAILKTRRQLVGYLERWLPENPDKRLPDELVLKILEYLLVEEQQPVEHRPLHEIRMSCGRPPYPAPFDPTWKPCSEKCARVFDAIQPSRRLLALAHEAYYGANTILIYVPTERSTKQVLRSPSFVMPWAHSIRRIELSMRFDADSANPVNMYVHVPGLPPPLPVRYSSILNSQDVDRIFTLLQSLKQAFPRLRHLTFMLSVEHMNFSPRPIICRGFSRNVPSGSLCCILANGDKASAGVVAERIAPLLTMLEFHYAALKWYTQCGHKSCKEGMVEQLKAHSMVEELVVEDEYTTAVLRRREMAPLA